MAPRPPSMIRPHLGSVADRNTVGQSTHHHHGTLQPYCEKESAISNQFRLLTRTHSAHVTCTSRNHKHPGHFNSYSSRSLLEQPTTMERAHMSMANNHNQGPPPKQHDATFQDFANSFATAKSYKSGRRDDIPDFLQCSDSSFSTTPDDLLPPQGMDAEVQVLQSSNANSSLTPSWHTFQNTGSVAASHLSGLAGAAASYVSGLTGGASVTGSRFSTSESAAAAASVVSGSSRSRQHAGDDEAQWEEEQIHNNDDARYVPQEQHHYGHQQWYERYPLSSRQQQHHNHPYDKYYPEERSYDEYPRHRQCRQRGPASSVYPSDDRRYHQGRNAPYSQEPSNQTYVPQQEPAQEHYYRNDDPRQYVMDDLSRSTATSWSSELYRNNCRRSSHVQREAPRPPPSPVCEGEPPAVVAPTTTSEKLVEIAPGVSVPLRGSQETLQAVSNDQFTPMACSACSEEIFGISNALYILCPKCKCITPLDHDSTANGGRRPYGLGLGFDFDSLFEMQASLVSEAASKFKDPTAARR